MAKAQMKFKVEHLVPGRVLHEDDDYLTVEIAKNKEGTFTLEDGDRFFTMLFVRAVSGRPKSWKPWERGNRD